MSTPAQLVREFNYVFGTLRTNAPAATYTRAHMTQAAALVLEETRELLMGVEANNRVEIIDGVADTFVVAEGMLARAGIDGDSLQYPVNRLKQLRGDLNTLIAGDVSGLGFARAIETLLYDIEAYAALIAFKIGAPALTAFKIVHENNMQKLCASEEDADLTMAKYAQDYAAGLSPYASTKKSRVGGYWVVRDAMSDKILKCWQWAPPNLEGL
jgi:phosphoribosyl-ATP pyrophosphohydrolase